GQALFAQSLISNVTSTYPPKRAPREACYEEEVARLAALPDQPSRQPTRRSEGSDSDRVRPRADRVARADRTGGRRRQVNYGFVEDHTDGDIHAFSTARCHGAARPG